MGSSMKKHWYGWPALVAGAVGLTAELVYAQDQGESAAAGQQAVANPPPIWDSIEFKTGGSLTGKIIQRGVPDDSNRKTFLVFETVTGGRLKIDESQLKPVMVVSESAEMTEYLRRLSALPDEATAHRELYQWCESQTRGRTLFADQIRFHLQRIVALDPNDEEARRALGMTEIDGRWIDKDQNYLARGYVYDRRWVPQTRKLVNQQLDAEEERLGEAKSRFVKWSRNLNRPAAELARDLQEILAIHPQMCLVLIKNIAEKSPPENLRLLMLETLATQVTLESYGNLVMFAVEDPSENVRDRTLSLLEQPAYQAVRGAIAARVIANYLPHPRNDYVNRAAFILQSLGDESAWMPLIDNLRTQHKVANPNPAKPGGISAGNQGMNIGGGSGPPEISVTLTNDGCLTTLRKLTQQDFGFDVLRWRRWYAEQVTNTTASMRRDD